MNSQCKYKAKVALTFLSNAPLKCAGVDGSPGESVHIKVGLINHSVKVSRDQSSMIYSLRNVDTGIPGQSGYNLKLAGIFGTSKLTDCNSSIKFAQVVRHVTLDDVRPGVDGRIVLLFGTDSSFMGVTTIFWQQANVQFEVISCQ